MNIYTLPAHFAISSIICLEPSVRVRTTERRCCMLQLAAQSVIAGLCSFAPLGAFEALYYLVHSSRPLGADVFFLKCDLYLATRGPCVSVLLIYRIHYRIDVAHLLCHTTFAQVVNAVLVVEASCPRVFFTFFSFAFFIFATAEQYRLRSLAFPSCSVVCMSCSMLPLNHIRIARRPATTRLPFPHQCTRFGAPSLVIRHNIPRGEAPHIVRLKFCQSVPYTVT